MERENQDKDIVQEEKLKGDTLSVSEAFDLVTNGNLLPTNSIDNVNLAMDNANSLGREEQLTESQAELLVEEKRANVAELSPLRIVLKRFMRSKLSMIGVGMLLFLLLFSFVGPVIYNQWSELEVDRSTGAIEYVYHEIKYVDEEGNEQSLFVLIQRPRDPNWWADPSGQHLFGTDRNGMDVFVRLMYGGRVSLLIALVVILLQTLIGIIMGGLAGFFGKWVDQLIMRIVEIFICVPSLPLLIIIGAIASDPQIDLGANVRIMILIGVMIFFGWANIARIVRGQILALRDQEYMVATEAMGFSSKRRIFKHLIPNVMPVLLVTMTLGFGTVILAEAGLSFLGFGVPQPRASWGGMLSQITDPSSGRLVEFLSKRVLLWLAPGLMILMAVLAFNFIGDGLRDAMDPRARR